MPQKGVFKAKFKWFFGLLLCYFYCLSWFDPANPCLYLQVQPREYYNNKSLTRIPYGHVRQFFPKATNFDLVKPIEVKRIMDKLNSRSGKTLNFNSHKQIFSNDSLCLIFYYSLHLLVESKPQCRPDLFTCKFFFLSYLLSKGLWMDTN